MSKSTVCCSVTFSLAVSVVIVLASLGIYTGMALSQSPCYILTSPIDYICNKASRYGRGEYYISFVNYNVYVVAINETRLGSYNCGESKECYSCSNATLELGSLQDCYTSPAMGPNYSIGQATDQSAVILVVSSVFLISAVVVTISFIITTVRSRRAMYYMLE